MTDEQIKQLVKAIDRHGESIRYLANSISEDNPLSETIYHGLESAGEMIKNGLESLGPHVGQQIEGVANAIVYGDKNC